MVLLDGRRSLHFGHRFFRTLLSSKGRERIRRIGSCLSTQHPLGPLNESSNQLEMQA